jgi:hypothetical protein
MSKQSNRIDSQVNQDAVQESRVYLAYTRTINPATGKVWTMKQIAREVGEHFGHVQRRLALVSQVAVKSKRPRMRTVGEVQRLFDETDEENVERRRAFAECMEMSLGLAIKESEARRSASLRKQEVEGDLE